MECTDDHRTALAAALENWTVQREPADARLVLEAALATGDPDAAEPVARFVRDSRLQDVRIDFLLRQLFGETSS